MQLRNLLLALGLLAIPACTTPRNVPPGQSAAHFERTLTKKVSLEYLVYLPPDAANQKKLPAIFFLHGSGERGTNVWQVAKHGPPKVVQEKTNFPFIVFSPQCPPGKSWDPDVVVAFVKQMKREYPIDPDRVYLTGLSLGGAGTWNALLEHPGLFAAAVPICGRTDTNGLAFMKPEKLEKVRHLPIWVFHGAKDPAVPVKYSEDMVAALKALNANVKLTIYPDAVHDSWTQTYANPELYDWLLAQNRKNNGTAKK
jgi:predicted peptidase